MLKKHCLSSQPSCPLATIKPSTLWSEVGSITTWPCGSFIVTWSCHLLWKMIKKASTVSKLGISKEEIDYTISSKKNEGADQTAQMCLCYCHIWHKVAFCMAWHKFKYYKQHMFFSLKSLLYTKMTSSIFMLYTYEKDCRLATYIKRWLLNDSSSDVVLINKKNKIWWLKTRVLLSCCHFSCK